MTPLFDIIMYVTLGLYLGVFLREYGNLKFTVIAYPFTFLLERLKKLTNKQEINKNAKDKKES